MDLGDFGIFFCILFWHFENCGENILQVRGKPESCSNGVTLLISANQVANQVAAQPR